MKEINIPSFSDRNSESDYIPSCNLDTAFRCPFVAVPGTLVERNVGVEDGIQVDRVALAGQGNLDYKDKGRIEPP